MIILNFVYMSQIDISSALHYLVLFRYHDLYLRAKGNAFKNKRNLMEFIFKRKTENTRSKQLA